MTVEQIYSSDGHEDVSRRQPTVENLEELDHGDFATQYTNLVITEERNIYGTDSPVNGDNVEALTGESVRSILSGQETDRPSASGRKADPEYLDEAFAALDVPLRVKGNGRLIDPAALG